MFAEVFGDKGVHARTAVGVNMLPRGVPVEIDAIVEVDSACHTLNRCMMFRLSHSCSPRLQIEQDDVGQDNVGQDNVGQEEMAAVACELMRSSGIYPGILPKPVTLTNGLTIKVLSRASRL